MIRVRVFPSWEKEVAKGEIGQRERTEEERGVHMQTQHAKATFLPVT